jgi:hypothetical protein
MNVHEVAAKVLNLSSMHRAVEVIEEAMQQARAEALEEAAKVAEEFHGSKAAIVAFAAPHLLVKLIAAAIRALAAQGREQG